MSEMVIFYYICCWSRGSLHVYSLVGGLIPGSSGGIGWYILLFLLWGCKPLQSLGPFSSCSTGDPVLSLLVGCEPWVFWFPLLRRIEVSTLWSSFFLSFMWSVKYILGIPSFWAIIHLSVSAYHEFFCYWVTSLRIFSTSIHLPKNYMNSLFLIAE